MKYQLADKRALVCGGSQGIGYACAASLAELGAEVTLLARNEETLRVAAGKLDTGAGQTHRYLVSDTSDPESLRATVAAHLETVGPHQILVNNSGGPPSGPILEANPTAFSSAITSHVICNQLLVQTLLPGMKESGYGRVINIISVSVVMPIQGLGVSNTTRGAVANWGRSMAGELAPLGITVNNILPGYTATERLGSLFEKKAARAGTTAEAEKRQTMESIPMKRFADPLEIGRVVAFLATPRASYLTGVNLPIDGGRTAVQ